MTPDHGYGLQASYVTVIFHFIVIIFILCQWYDKKKLIAFTDSFDST